MRQTARTEHRAPAFCPRCGRPFSEMEKMLSEHNPNHQCHYCWSSIRVVTARDPGPRHGARKSGRVIPLAGKQHR
jgi:DNA-directed RNA polymerase subunit RPC12/RpoP